MILGQHVTIVGLIWQYAHITKQMTITLPLAQNNATETPVMNGLANHYVEVWIRTTSLIKPRWTLKGQVNNNVVILKSIDFPDNSNLFETKLSETTMLTIGASYSEGYGAVGKEHADFKSNDATCSWGVLLGTALGFNVATSGYAGSGFVASGNGKSPQVGIAYKYMDNGIPREYTGIDIVGFNVGTNDVSMSSDSFVNAASEMIDDLRKRFPAMILLFTIPFGGAHRSDWLKVGEKYQEDTRVIVLDTIYPQLTSHPTISNYKQYILPDLVKKAGKALFSGDIMNNPDEGVYVQKSSPAQNVYIQSSNHFEQYKIKKL